MNNRLALDAAGDLLGSDAALARALGVTSSYVWQLKAGRRQISPEHCPTIERLTAGIVRCEDLRPDVRWRRIDDQAWPHPEGRPCIDLVGAES